MLVWLAGGAGNSWAVQYGLALLSGPGSGDVAQGCGDTVLYERCGDTDQSATWNLRRIPETRQPHGHHIMTNISADEKSQQEWSRCE